MLAGGLFDYADLGAQALKGVSRACATVHSAGCARQRESLRCHPRRGCADAAGGTRGGGRTAAAPLGAGQGGRGSGGAAERRARHRQEPHHPGAARAYRCRAARAAALPVLAVSHPQSRCTRSIEQFERAAGFARDDTSEQKLDKLEALLGEAAEDRPIGRTAVCRAAVAARRIATRPCKLSPQKQKERTLAALAHRSKRCRASARC